MTLSKLKRLLYLYFLINKIKNKTFNLAVTLNIIKPIENKPIDFCDRCRTGLMTVNELRTYSRSNNESIQADIVSAPNCPGDVLLLLSKDTSDFVQFCVASNPHTNKYILDYLSTHGDDAVKSAVMVNKNCSYQTRNLLMQNEHCEAFIAVIPDLEEKFIRKYFRLDKYTTEKMCARQNLPYDLIENIIKENDETLMKALRFNPRLRNNLLIHKEG